MKPRYPTVLSTPAMSISLSKRPEMPTMAVFLVFFVELPAVLCPQDVAHGTGHVELVVEAAIVVDPGFVLHLLPEGASGGSEEPTSPMFSSMVTTWRPSMPLPSMQDP